MKAPRVVLVSRRFWPLVGGAESAMANLAAEFKAQGAECTILTAGWERSWPSEIVHHGVHVVRLRQPSLRFYGTWRYLRELTRWLEMHRETFDVVYVSMLKHCAYAAVTVGQKHGFPVVLRAEGAGATGDCFWQVEANFGQRIKRQCKRADAIVAPSAAIERELIAAGYARERIHAIPNGAALRPIADAQTKADVRAALAEAEPALSLDPHAPLALYTGRLHLAKGLSTLVQAWSRVNEQLPSARLWLIGEGPQRAELLQQIEALGLAGRIAIAGPFDQVDDLLAAADLYVLPSLEEGMSIALLEAMSAALPIVATRIPGNETLIEHERQGLLVPVDAEADLANAMLSLFQDRTTADSYGRAARARVEERFSISQAAAEHLRLFERLLAGRKRSPESS